jgi:uncharacterized membrane protein
MKKKVLTSAIIAGAVSLAAGSAGVANAANKVKCYGVAPAGKNDCAARGHSCGGHSSESYSYKEWAVKTEEECKEMHGSLRPMEGINEYLAKEKGSETEQKDIETEEKYVETEQKNVETEQKNVETEQKSANMEQKDADCN